MLNVASITVTLNPDTAKLKRQLASLHQLSQVILIDNGSVEEVVADIQELSKQFPNVRVTALEQNMGIAYAQNLGVRLALESRMSVGYLLFLDHDSIPEPGAINKMVAEAFNIARYHGDCIGAVGPRLVDPRSGFDYGFHQFSRFGIKKVYASEFKTAIVECDQINSSGSLIPVDSWEKVGPFNEELFIDHVESDWCFRAKHQGLKLFGILNAVVWHEMGDNNCVYWFFGKHSMPYRSPQRHYYIVRNSIYLQKQQFTPVRWKLLNVPKLLFTYLYFGLFTNEKLLHRKKIYQALLDGIKGIMGEDRNSA